MKIEGKAFIVTGGAGSIGGAIARHIIERGGTAIIFDVLETQTGTERVKTYHPDRAFYFQTDISDGVALEKSCQQALKVIPKGSLYGGVHCAAIASSTPWVSKVMDKLVDFEKVLKVNAYGTFAVDAAIADAINSQYGPPQQFPARTEGERGIIINIASIAGKPVPARCLTYGASKTCVLGITQGMADFLGPSGIRVNSISPSIVASGGMGPDRIPYFESEMNAAAIFPRRVALADEMAHGAMYLIENSMMNDFDLRIDGGWRGSSNWGGEKDPRSTAPSME